MWRQECVNRIWHIDYRLRYGRWRSVLATRQRALSLQASRRTARSVVDAVFVSAPAQAGRAKREAIPQLPRPPGADLLVRQPPLRGRRGFSCKQRRRRQQRRGPRLTGAGPGARGLARAQGRFIVGRAPPPGASCCATCPASRFLRHTAPRALCRRTRGRRRSCRFRSAGSSRAFSLPGRSVAEFTERRSSRLRCYT